MRCNIIDVSHLTDQHLIAERNEVRWIPPLLETKYKKRGMGFLSDIPNDYCLGTGHMNFWTNKMKYLENRFNEITSEMIRRGFKPNLSVQFDCELAKKIGMYLDWTPNQQDFDIITNRLREKILLKFSWYRFCSVPISIEWFESIYRNETILCR